MLVSSAGRNHYSSLLLVVFGLYPRSLVTEEGILLMLQPHVHDAIERIGTVGNFEAWRLTARAEHPNNLRKSRHDDCLLACLKVTGGTHSSLASCM